MKKLLKYLKPYRKECIIAPAFKMLEALFELFVPLVIKRIIDEGIKLQNPAVIWQSAAVLVSLGIIGLVCALIAQFFSAKAAIGFATGVRNSLYDKILGFSYENVDVAGTSSLITRMTNDINTAQNGVNMFLRLFLRSPFVVFGAMIMAFTINVKAALIFVVVIPVLFVAVFLITLITIPMYKRIQASLDRLTGHIRENLTGARVIRAFSRGDSEKKEFTDENDKFFHLSVVTSRISTLLNPLTLIIVNVAMLILIANGATLVNGGILTSGEVYALVNYMSQILVELVKLANLFITINKSLASASRISATFELESALKDEGTLTLKDIKESDNILEFKNVSFAYPGAGDNSLTDISFSIKKGETVGIIGGTGSGKSTVINLLMRFYDTTSGEVLYNGVNVKDIALSSLRSVFSLVPQRAQLFSGTLRDNLLFANPSATEDDMRKAVELSVSENVVMAKGEGRTAELMISEAQKNDIHITEDTVLVDMLGMSEVGSMVPESAWKALAVIFSYILSDEEKRANEH
ncbi:MAG: ATP-binding cassette domain-containing protein [Lachnospiraceae bacterium]|nr:ATP-binding cassette domain-containing protein [Lachnospiraceae bacterium]